MPNANANKIIYSLRIYLALKELNIESIATMENPMKSGFLCWVYKKTPEFIKALDDLMGGN